MVFNYIYGITSVFNHKATKQDKLAICGLYQKRFNCDTNSNQSKMCRGLLLFSLLVCACYATFPRSVVRTLSVSNGGRWGEWQEPSFCPNGQFASGYRLKIEPRRGSYFWQDDSSLNGIELLCSTRSTTSDDGFTVSSGYGPWGDWKGLITCDRKGQFLTSFSLQVEDYQGNGDDTAANYVKFICHDFDHHRLFYSYRFIGGRGFWGDYGAWSQRCQQGSAICGLRTKLESPQGNGDDTALNDVEFYCCGSD